MKRLNFVLGLLLMSIVIASCDKEQVLPAKPEVPEVIEEEPVKPKEEKPLTKDLLALKKLGLRSLEIAPTALPPLPPLPAPADPSDNVGLDTRLQEWEEWWRNIPGGTPDNPVLIGEPPRVISRYIIWAYGRPRSIVLGYKVHIPISGSRELDSDASSWEGKPSLPITLNCKNDDYATPYSTEFIRTNPNNADRFDSLTREHGVVPGNEALHNYTAMPYDLRHMRIAHEGIDISPLFSMRYQDFKEVVRTNQYNKWYWRDVRISDVGMDVLDWIFDGYFELYPLTKDYPRFTIIFILKDGTVISREVEHRV